MLDGVGIEEVLRGLHEPDHRIVEQSKGANQEVAVGNEIRIEHGDEIGLVRGAAQPRQHVIDVAGLAVLVVRPGDMLDTC